MNIGFWIFLLINCIVFGCITRAINNSKGRDGGFWWGFFLGGIGIVVVACRHSIVEESTPSYSTFNNYGSNAYTGSLSEAKPAKPIAPASWKCAKCGRENEISSNFCCDCGERRHYKWKCAKCEKENAPEIRFCPECGNQQTDEQELVPAPPSTDELFLASLEEMSSAAEIADAFAEKYAGSDDENIREMISRLEKAKSSERLYGNMKKSSLEKVKAFYKSNMQFYQVDRSIPTITCPVCGKQQTNSRDTCFMCGALFRD